MSKWINKDLFNGFKKQKKQEKEQTGSNLKRSELVWQNPQKGTTETPKTYEGRLLADPKDDLGKPYRKFLYHMWQAGDKKWNFILCTKTFDMTNFCPCCAINNKLYKGTEDDKKMAFQIKRKEKFVTNFYIVNDPRDSDREEDERVNGTVRLYEFPSKVEQIIKKEIIDDKEGYGAEIFDPGPDGRNFLIKVLSTKKDAKGKEWPDYSMSGFSRSQSAVADSDEEIDKIMEKRIDLEKYIRSMSMKKEKVIEILQNEFLWELVEDQAKNSGYLEGYEVPKKEERKKDEKPDPEDDIDDSIWDSNDSDNDSTNDDDTDTDTDDTDSADSDTDTDDDGDEDLLAELDDL